MLRKAVGWWRLLWGFCPGCNSDAPAVDSCKVCQGISRKSGEGVPVILNRAVAWQRFTRV